MLDCGLVKVKVVINCLCMFVCLLVKIRSLVKCKTNHRFTKLTNIKRMKIQKIIAESSLKYFYFKMSLDDLEYGFFRGRETHQNNCLYTMRPVLWNVFDFCVARSWCEQIALCCIDWLCRLVVLLQYFIISSSDCVWLVSPSRHFLTFLISIVQSFFLSEIQER